MNITDINNAAGGPITDLPSHYLVIDDSGLARLVTPVSYTHLPLPPTPYV